jgi:hypothetical protein
MGERMSLKPTGKGVRKRTPVVLTEACPTEAQIAALRELLRPHLPPESILAISIATMRGSVTVALRLPKGQRNVTYTTDEVQQAGLAWPWAVFDRLTSQTA